MNINGNFCLEELELIRAYGIEDKEVLIDVLSTKMGKFNVTESSIDRFFYIGYRNTRDKLMEIDQAEYESIDFSVLKDLFGDANEDDDDYGEDTSL
jgi:hypothetical protein